MGAPINKTSRIIWLIGSLSTATLLIFLYLITVSNSAVISYNSQIKPLLNEHCIHCHGGVKQSGGFSLMTRELALRENDSGLPAIVPGSPNQSELIRRIKLNNPEERMPYEASPLHPKEIELLEQWIEQGANWEKHWAYNPVQKTIPPNIMQGNTSPQKNQTQNEIDHFVLDKIYSKGLHPNPSESKAKLLRRLSLDLTGLPPDSSLSRQFLRNITPISYEQLVDSLLASGHFGEHWTAMWLDLARYADSKGFERDVSRTIWPYRDYLIKSFNEDLPYDQFLIEQLAGDLLTDPSDKQYIATGFHRNTPTNDEGGTDNEEYRVAATIDRINTTYEALLGTTFACTQCHGHPYDPFPHKTYYESLAFFNNTRDYDTHRDYPWLRQFTKEEEAKLEELTQWVAMVENPSRAMEIRTFLKTYQPTYYSLECDSMINADLYDTKYLGFRQNGAARLPDIHLTDRPLLLIKTNWFKPGGRLDIRLDHPDGQLIGSWQIPDAETSDRFFEIPIDSTTGNHDLHFSYYNPNLEDPDVPGLMIDWFYFSKLFPGRTYADHTSRKKTYRELLQSNAPHTLIMMENESARMRSTHIFDRGNWQVHLEEVTPNVPSIFPPIQEDLNKDRLALAKWITDPNHPLTGRVYVNRLWAKLFGKGIVQTLEDFGSQGEAPSHPELLDWLAWTFVHDFDWSTKRLLKLIVSSATYRQSTEVNKEHLAIDPLNTWLARGPRNRLSAEQIRDQALFVSGLLNPELFGPPVMPFQPEGIWQVPYNAESWTLSADNQRYRRGLYTFMKRSAPYPSFETFDLAPRQVCVSRRITTNTPLQALVTLNDPVFVEAAQHLAFWMLDKAPGLIDERIRLGYRKAMGYPITEERLNILLELYQETLNKFKADSQDIDKLLGDLNFQSTEIEAASTVILANALLNLDEFLMK
jgi:hypothetical protein